MKNWKPLFHHVLQRVSYWKKELPDGDRRQGRRDYTIDFIRNKDFLTLPDCRLAVSEAHQ